MASSSRTRPSHRFGRRRRHLAPLRILVALAIALATLPFVAGSAAVAASPVTTIDIDGDQAGQTTDWQGLFGTTSVDVIKDGVGTNDTTGIKGAERDYPAWEAIDPSDSQGSPSGKSDIGYVRVASYRVGGDATSSA